MDGVCQVRQQILKGERSPVDLVVGSLGGLSKLVHEGYIKRDRAAVIALGNTTSRPRTRLVRALQSASLKHHFSNFL